MGIIPKWGSNEIMEDTLLKGILVAAGTFFLVLGIIGIFIPLLPTTPFLLLAAACYAKGSKKFYAWLINNKWLGRYITNYREGRGIPFTVKILSITLLWLTILFSTIIIVSNILVRIILIIIAIGVTIHILSIKTLDKQWHFFLIYNICLTRYLKHCNLFYSLI